MPRASRAGRSTPHREWSSAPVLLAALYRSSAWIGSRLLREDALEPDGGFALLLFDLCFEHRDAGGGVCCCSRCSCATLPEVACERFLRARAGQGESHADLRSSLAVPPSRSLALRSSRGRVRRSRGQQRLVLSLELQWRFSVSCHESCHSQSNLGNCGSDQRRADRL
jgi:hypothetical protein